MWSATTATAHWSAATAPGREATTRLTTDAATATRSSAARISKGLLRADTALFDLELETVDGVGVVANSVLECGRGLEVDESTVLGKD